MWRALPLATLVALMASCSDGATSLRSGGGGGSSGDDGSSSGAPGSSGSAPGSSGSSTNPGGGSAAEICVATINEYRKTMGLAPYARWAEAEACSDGQAKSDGDKNAPHGAFGKCQEQGQNECPGFAGTPEKMITKCLEMMWGEGPGGGHYEAMASTRYTKVACGFATTAKGSVWSVQNFR
ncbi:MAG: hypothetical protein KF819_25965 [Labilithrix sp.]|nr:hypothetical protein [Labilithrix sp.]